MNPILLTLCPFVCGMLVVHAVFFVRGTLKVLRDGADQRVDLHAGSLIAFGVCGMPANWPALWILGLPVWAGLYLAWRALA